MNSERLADSGPAPDERFDSMTQYRAGRDVAAGEAITSDAWVRIDLRLTRAGARRRCARCGLMKSDHAKMFDAANVCADCRSSATSYTLGEAERMTAKGVLENGKLARGVGDWYQKQWQYEGRTVYDREGTVLRRPLPEAVAWDPTRSYARGDVVVVES
jgi:hypothetical protein